MPRQGDTSAKIGNRYEDKWTIYCVIQILLNKFEKIQLGALDEDKAEFYLQSGNNKEYHQAKRQLPSGNWTLKKLESEGILESLKRSLEDSTTSWVFVSGHPAPELRELSEQAREAKTWKNFSDQYLNSAEISNKLKTLQKFWGNPSDEDVFQALLRIRAITLDEEMLNELNIAHLQKFYSSPQKIKNVIAILREYISEHVNAELASEEIWLHLKERGFPPNTSKIAPLMDHQNSIEETLQSDIKNLSTLISEDVNKKLDTIDQARKEGKIESLQKQVAELKTSDVRWKYLTSEVTIKLLCIEAALEIDVNQGFEKAVKILKEARKYGKTSRLMRMEIWLKIYGFHNSRVSLRALKSDKGIESRNLYSAILLDQNRLREARQEIEGISEPNADTYRILALLNLKEGDLDEAKRNIERALSNEPKWINIRFLDAVIKYLACVSPLILNEIKNSWPWPPIILRPLVKLRQSEIDTFKEASVTFIELPNLSLDASITPPQLWYLASIISHQFTQAVTSEYCRKLLQIDPTHIPTMLMATVHHLDIDFRRMEENLEAIVSSERATPQYKLFLADVYSIEGKQEKLEQFLANIEHEFDIPDLRASWLDHYIRVLLDQNRVESAAELIQETNLNDEIVFALRTLLLDYEVRKTGNWDLLLKHLETRYLHSNSPLSLLSYCQALREAGEWDQLYKLIHELVNVIDTSDANWLAIQTFYEVESYQECIEMIDNYLQHFVPIVPKNHVLNIRVSVLENLGRLNEAIDLALKLTEEEPTEHNYLNLAHLYYVVGDKAALELLARKISKQFARSDLLLNLASLMQYQNPPLATNLFRKALSQGLPDEMVGIAFVLTQQLDLHDEAQAIFDKLMILASQGKGGIQAVTPKDFLKWNTERHVISKDFGNKYHEGSIPIHMFADKQYGPLINLYFLNFHTSINNPNLFRNTSIFLRHGGKPIVKLEKHAISNLKLNMDITSILTAANLELLSLVEETFSPIYIPQAVIPSLLSMETTLLQSHPAIIQGKTQVNRLVKEGAIRVVKTTDIIVGKESDGLQNEIRQEQIILLHLAQANNGYFADVLPLHKFTSDIEILPSDIPPYWEKYIISRKIVADSLRKLGVIDTEKYRECEIKLQDEVSVQRQIDLKRHAAIYFDGHALETLAQANILISASDNFTLFVTQEYADQVDREVREYEYRDNTVELLRQVIRHLNEGIAEKRYEFLPNAKISEDFHYALNMESILTLLHITPDPNSVIWIDDRFSNSSSFGQIPTIGVNDVLQMLLTIGKISIESYYAYLIKLRAANARYIPIELEEILYHLKQAPIVTGVLIETPELKTLRKYIAACMGEPNDLQYPLNLSENMLNKQGEIAFVGGLKLNVYKIFSAIWTQVEDTENRYLYANWVVDNVLLDYMALIETYNDVLQDFKTHRFIPDFAGLVMQAFTIFGVEGKKRSANVELISDLTNWLWNRLLKPQVLLNSGLLESAVEQIKSYFTNALDSPPKPSSEIEREIRFLSLQTVHSLLPQEIRVELNKDEEFTKSINIEIKSVIQIDKFEFDAENFWASIGNAMGGSSAILDSLNDGTQIELRSATEDGEIRASFFSSSGDKIGELQIHHAGILSSNIELQISDLEFKRYWLDCDNSEFNNTVETLSHIPEVYKRVQTVDRLLDDSATVYYSNLLEQLRSLKSEGKVNLHQLVPPSLNSLRKHLRFPQKRTNFANDFELATKTFLTEENLAVTIQHLSSLPVPIPKQVLDKFIGAEKHEQNQIIQSIPINGSPIQLFHLLTLHAILGNQEIVQLLLQDLLSSNNVERVVAFQNTLFWVNRSFEGFSDDGDFDHATLLAFIWTHAHYLFLILRNLGVSYQSIAEFFLQPIPVIKQAFKDIFDESYYDIAYPSRIDPIGLTLAGIGNSAKQSGDMNLIAGHYEEVRDFAFTSENGVSKVLPNLLRDSLRLNNLLSSYLSFDLAELYNGYLPDDSHFLNIDERKSLTKGCLANLFLNSTDRNAWVILNRLIGDLPIYEDLRSELLKLLLSTDYIDLYRKNLELGYEASHFAFSQLPHFPTSELYEKSQNTLINLTYFLANDEEKIRKDHDTNQINDFIVNTLIEPTLTLAVISENKHSELIHLFDQILDIWPITVATIRPLIENLHERAEANTKKDYWALIMKCRARYVDNL